MVLGNDFGPLVVEEDKVLYVVDQTLLAEQALYQVEDGGAFFRNLLSVYLLFLVVDAQPLEEEFVAGVKSAQLSSQPVGEHAYLVQREDVGNFFTIAAKVFVVGLLHFHGGVLQFDEHQWQTVHEQQHIGTAVAEMALDPHLVDGGKVVFQRTLKIDQLHNHEIVFAVYSRIDFDSVPDLVIEPVVGIDDVGAGEVFPKILDHRIDNLRSHPGIDVLQAGA